MIVKRETGSNVRQTPSFSSAIQGKQSSKAPPPATVATSQDGSVTLRLVRQPETQHRARYQTEGSRGCVKDRTGSSFPTVTLEGAKRPTNLQIFVGAETAAGAGARVPPHMFYQVCRVPGKQSAAARAQETRVRGTTYLELWPDPRTGPGRGQGFVCDCIGILKERFSDVETRFPNDSTQWKEEKRKSSHCRLVFAATVETPGGNVETLQVASDLIHCTQLPGTPDIQKVSTRTSPAGGGAELWIIGKNFLKDTKVNFSYVKPGKQAPIWNKFVSPIKEFFHPNHLIVKIPAFYTPHVYHDVQVQLMVRSSGGTSEPLTFTYLAAPGPAPDTPKISVIRSTKSAAAGAASAPPSSCSKPTILQPVERAVETKRARVERSPLSPWRPLPAPLARRGSHDSRNSRDCERDTSSDSSSPGRAASAEDVSSSLTMDFTEFFRSRRAAAELHTTPAPRGGEAGDPGEQQTAEYPVAPATSSLSIEEAATEEKATIAISLPPSILTNQGHMRSIIETLNTAFCQDTDQEPGTSGQARKRTYTQYTEAAEAEEGTSVTRLEAGQQQWSSQQLENVEEKKWNEDINEILGTVIEEQQINFEAM